MSRKPPEASADRSDALADAKAVYAGLLRAACQLGASPLTARDIAEESNGALELETVGNYLSGKTAPPKEDAHNALAGLIGSTLTLKGARRASEYAEIRKKLDAAYRDVQRIRRTIRPRSSEAPGAESSSSMQVAALAAISVAAKLDLAIEHLRHVGGPLLFASRDKFADNETLAHDLFARLEPIDFALVSRLDPLGMEPGLRVVKGFDGLAKARRLLEDSLPSGGIDGLIIRREWTAERDAKFKELLRGALSELEAAAALCRHAGMCLEARKAD